MEQQPIFIAITGTQHYFGTAFLRPGQIVYLIKEPDNSHDHEAIKVDIVPIGKIGYVANSTNTVPRGCWSAGRIYDTFEHHICGCVRFVIKDTAIVELVPGIEEMYVFNLLRSLSIPVYGFGNVYSLTTSRRFRM